jgi:hypothetical protein
MSNQTFPCFMNCGQGDPRTSSSYVIARLKTGPHEMAVDFHTECFVIFNDARLNSRSLYAKYELLFDEIVNFSESEQAVNVSKTRSRNEARNSDRD